MGTCFGDEIQKWSADDKNKLFIGGGSPCVSRYHTFGTYVKKGDEFRTSDHNFSTGYKGIVSGYMRVEEKPAEPGTSHEKFRYDKLGRVHFKYPRTGRLFIT